jgi:hypothetical protein
MQVVGVKQLMKLTKRKLSHPEAETEDVAPSANRQHPPERMIAKAVAVGLPGYGPLPAAAQDTDTEEQKTVKRRTAAARH